MKLRLICVMAAICGITQCLSAQQNFVPGEIYLSGKDTVRGFINYQNWESNPRKIQFKKSENDDRSVYTVLELDGFDIYQQDSYRKAVVMIDMNPIEVNDVTTWENSLVKKDTLFLRKVATANHVALYEYYDFKIHFFLQSGPEIFEELKYRRSANPATYNVTTDNWFRTQLKQAFGDSITKKQLRTIDNLSYNSRDLRKLFESVSGIKNEQTNTSAAQKNKKPVSIFAGGGVTYTKFGINSPNNNWSSIEFDPTTSYIFSGGLDVLNGRNFNRLFMRIELSLSELHAKGEGISKMEGLGFTQTNYYSLKQQNITPAVSVMYSFIRLNKTRVYAGATLGVNFSSYDDDTYKNLNHFTNLLSVEENYFKPEKFWIDVLARAGVILSKKFEAGLSYQIAGSFFNYNKTSETANPISLRLYYHFN